jgi:hypothetical protein
MDVSGQLHASAALTPGKEPPVPLDEAGWVPEPVWIPWTKTSCPAENLVRILSWQKNFCLLGYNAVLLKLTEVSEKHVASIFKVEEQAIQTLWFDTFMIYVLSAQ